MSTFHIFGTKVHNWSVTFSKFQNISSLQYKYKKLFFCKKKKKQPWHTKKNPNYFTFCYFNLHSVTIITVQPCKSDWRSVFTKCRYLLRRVLCFLTLRIVEIYSRRLQGTKETSAVTQSCFSQHVHVRGQGCLYCPRGAVCCTASSQSTTLNKTVNNSKTLNESK